MGLYNLLKAVVMCPRCSRSSEMEIELFFGFMNLIEYAMGDVYRWASSPVVRNGGRPVDGNLDGEGYVGACPACRRDFFVLVHVRSDILESVEPDAVRRGYVPD